MIVGVTVFKIVLFFLALVLLFGLAVKLFELLIVISKVILSVIFAALLFACLTLHFATYPVVALLRIRFKGCKSLLQLFYFASDRLQELKFLGLSAFSIWFQTAKNSQEKKQNQQEGKKKTYTQAKQTETFNPWNVLGIKRGATREDIEVAYKQKIKGNHPDKLANLDPYFQSIANERMKQINRAYSELMN